MGRPVTQRDSNLGRFDFGCEEEAPAPAEGGRGWVTVVVLIVVLLGAGAAYLWFFDRERASRWLDKAPAVIGSSETTAYKWQDTDGNWQITDKPPAGNIAYETITVRSDVNIVPSLKQPD